MTRRFVVPSRFVRFDPETVSMLDRCLDVAYQRAQSLGVEISNTATRNRLASALIEAAGTGERQESALVDFALSALPAYRGGIGRRPVRQQAAAL
jgi:hypothetical protein